jgi:hypothetical protein
MFAVIHQLSWSAALVKTVYEPLASAVSPLFEVDLRALVRIILEVGQAIPFDQALLRAILPLDILVRRRMESNRKRC